MEGDLTYLVDAVRAAYEHGRRKRFISGEWPPHTAGFEVSP